MKTLLILAAAAGFAFAAPVTPLTEARTIKYGDNDIARVACAPNYGTTIVLVGEDKIVKDLNGDSSEWVQQSFGTNTVYVKPSTRASETTLMLVGRSGRHYVFLLTLSQSPDLMVYVEPKETGISGMKRVKLYTEDEVAVYRKQLAEMDARVIKTQATVETIRQDADKKLAQAKAELPKRIKHPYRFARDKAPFNIRDMYTIDDRFTYIEGSPDELPAVYEERDGKPKVVQFSFEDGKYVADKILAAPGYFSIGKSKMPFYAR